MIQRHTRSTLFPYTTLFRSGIKTVCTFFRELADSQTPVFTNGHVLPTNHYWGQLVQNREKNCSFKVYGSAGYQALEDRKSTRLNSSHSSISYAVFCLKKKKN